MKSLEEQDKKIAGLIKKEEERQRETINLIASENEVSSAVREATGTVLMNKYSEGYPGRRYYPGNENVDEIERICQERALALFGLDEKEWGANVQPYSGSPANLAIYLALAPPQESENKKEIILGMKLAEGGHLTHGHKVSATGQIWKSVQYGVDKKGRIDYAEIERLAKKHKPKIIVSGATAYPREIDFKKIGKIARAVEAYHVADISHIAGLVAAGLHQSPFDLVQGMPYADVVMTTTHKTLRGPRGAVIFARKDGKMDSPAEPGNDPHTNRIGVGAGQARSGNDKRGGVTIYEAVNKAVFPGVQGGPHDNITAAKAVALKEASTGAFKKYQKQIIRNAQTLAESLKELGFNLITGGTDNHLLLVDVRNFDLTGQEAEERLERIGIIANRNAIPGDESPFRPSGLRLGTPASTSRGMKEGEMKKIAEIMALALTGGEGEAELKKRVREIVASLKSKV